MRAVSGLSGIAAAWPRAARSGFFLPTAKSPAMTKLRPTVHGRRRGIGSCVRGCRSGLLGAVRASSPVWGRAPGGQAMQQPRQYRYFEFVMVAFVVVLVCSNLIGPAKIAQVDIPFWGPYVFGAGVIFFPISYIFGDDLTEVYGYSRARRVIWSGFGALIFASLMAAVVVALPPAPFWKHQGAYEVAFGNTWRIVVASMVAYFCGEFVNSFVLAKMKIW